MVKNKILTGCYLVAFSTIANAAQYTITGSLTSYSASVSSGVLQPSSPQLEEISTGDVYFSPSGDVYVILRLRPEYHVVDFGSTTSKTYAGLRHDIGYGSTNFAFDETTGHLTGSAAAETNLGYFSYCYGAVNICSALYPEGNPATPHIDQVAVDFFFGADLKSFNGSVTINSALNNGATVSRVYTLGGVLAPPQVPLPMSSVLFGSTVLAMAGWRQRSKHN